MPHAPLDRIIAHRGASGDAPENTLGALKLAAEQGASCVEIDVSISADDVPFVHHDHNLQRCTNGHGLLCEHTAQQLDQLSAGIRMPGFEHEPLPRLDTVLALLIELNMGLNLEIKPFEGRALEQRTVAAICDSIKRVWPASLPLVFSCFNHHCLSLAKDYLPHVARAPLVGAVPDDWAALMQQFSAQNLHCAEDALTQEKAQAVVAAGYGLYCYTVNDAQRARLLFDWGVHGVFTDYPKALA